MIIDSDVLIWYLRGNELSKDIVEKNIPFSISVVNYMELVQGMRDKKEFLAFQKKIHEWNTRIIQVDEEISMRAMFYVEEFFLSKSMMLADAIIAATAIEKGLEVITANAKHYRYIPGIKCQTFSIK